MKLNFAKATTLKQETCLKDWEVGRGHSHCEGICGKKCSLDHKATCLCCLEGARFIYSFFESIGLVLSCVGVEEYILLILE